MAHQAQTLAWLLDRSRAALWLDIGTGKTLTALYAIQLWQCQRTLVVCPNSVIKTWTAEIKKHTELKYIVLSGTAHSRLEKLQEPAQIYIINYEGLKWLYGEKRATTRGDRRKKFVPSSRLFNDAAKFDAVVFDENHRTKSKKSLQARICAEISRQATKSIGMTGSPFTNNQLDLWSEFYVLDQGVSLGTNYWQFVNTYFKAAGYNYKLRKGALNEIMKRLKPSTIRFAKEDCMDLPEKTIEVRNLDLTDEQLDLIKQFIEEAKFDFQEGNKAAMMILGMKLLQIVGGFYKDEGKIRRLKSNPKMRELLSLLEEISGKVLVFHQFVEEGRMIEDALDKVGISYCSLRGEIKDQDQQYEDFITKKDKKVLIAHPACGGEGINLQCANTAIWYSNGYQYGQRVQAEGRIHRLGQKRPCTFIDLILDDGEGDSIDLRIQKALSRKRDASDEILDFLRAERLKNDLADQIIKKICKESSITS